MKRPDFKRWLDLALVVPALPVVVPVVAALAVAVKLDSKGPAFFAQTRVGRGKKPLRLYKLRSMVPDADKQGPLVTAAGDSRVTRVGRWLRKSKLDELPQLLNVLTGEMSLVGPRPEAERYVAHYRPEWEPLLDVRPGLTDLASLVFRDEEAVLGEASDRERAYVEAVMPEKLGVALEGVQHSSVTYDAAVIARTLAAVLKLSVGQEHPAVARAKARVAELNASKSSP